MGPTRLRRRNTVMDSQKWSGLYGTEHHSTPVTSSKFAGLLTGITPSTQSLCLTASCYEVYLITLKLEVENYMSLRALVDCGASNNFMRHQSLDDSKLKYLECANFLTWMTVRLATCAPVTAIKRVVGISFPLKEVLYEDLIVVDLDDKFDVILGLP